MRTRPDQITERSVNGHTIHLDEYGYLTDPDEWDESVAEHLAEAEGIALTPDHWAVLCFLRDYHGEHGIMADARFAFENLAKRKDIPKDEARALFFQLFPYGFVKQACKIAGMRQPRAWSTG